MEACDIDLKKYMRAQRRAFTQCEVCTLGSQLLNGLSWLHSHDILHRDLKPQNILLVTKTAPLKICDLGLARTVSPGRAYTLEVATIYYRPPELFLGASSYGKDLDMWSVGCVLYEMCTDTVAFRGDTGIEMLFLIFRKLGTPSARVWPGIVTMPHWIPGNFPVWHAAERGCTDALPPLATLLGQLWHYDPSVRPTCDVALRDPLFAHAKPMASLPPISV